MKIILKLIFAIFYFLTIRVGTSGQMGDLDNESFLRMIEDLSGNSFANSIRKLVFFELKKKIKKKKISTYMNYLQQFLLTTGVDCDLYNWNYQHFVAITKVDAEIDKDAILDRFKGIITDVGQKLAKDVIPGLKKEYNDRNKPPTDL